MPLLKVQPRRGQPQGLQVPPPAPPHISNPGRESSTHFLFPTRAKRTLLAFPGASWPRRIKSFAPGLARTPARLGAAASGRQGVRFPFCGQERRRADTCRDMGRERDREVGEAE